MKILTLKTTKVFRTSIFSQYLGKQGPDKLRMWTLFTKFNMPINIFKQCDFTYSQLEDGINNAFKIGKFTDCLKMENVTPLHKKDESTDKKIYD